MNEQITPYISKIASLQPAPELLASLKVQSLVLLAATTLSLGGGGSPTPVASGFSLPSGPLGLYLCTRAHSSNTSAVSHSHACPWAASLYPNVCATLLCMTNSSSPFTIQLRCQLLRAVFEKRGEGFVRTWIQKRMRPVWGTMNHTASGALDRGWVPGSSSR